MLDELQEQARKLYTDGEYVHALADFSVLREIRSRREGPYSVKYLANLHDCVRCMLPLRLWSDMTVLCTELHGKYVRTHGRAARDTVDVAKMWAWAMVQRHEYQSAVRLYLVTADAVWDIDGECARRLVGAAAAQPARPRDAAAEAGRGEIDGITLTHTTDLVAAIEALRAALGTDDGARPSLTVDGLAL